MLAHIRNLESLKNTVVAKVDPLGWLPSTAAVARRAVGNPVGVATATATFATNLAGIPAASALVALGETSVAPMSVDPRDKRFRSAAWRENPTYFGLLQSYLATRSAVDDLLDAGTGDELAVAKARQFARLLLDAAAPTNVPLTNPDFLIRAFETRGASVVRGAKNAVSDIVRRGGRPRQVADDAFEVGVDMAVTPGKVVYRNALIELIQYAPQTDTVHATPLLASPPWINKFYIMDLRPDRSLVEWAVRHNRTVFAISYRNPDSSMRDVTFDDYLTHGVTAAIDVITEITGADVVDIAGLCLGGAMASIAAAHFAAGGEDRIGSLTLINTILDYSEPGELGVMVDPATLDNIDRRMSATGYLPADDMSLTFDLLRANDLIFGVCVSRWLLGEPPSTFDLLSWNDDSTNMPAAMHSQYLRRLYGRNELALGEFEIAGRRLSLADVTNDVYVVGAVNDHIVPAKTSFAAVGLFGGHVRYVLSNGGHIAGIVNPPGKSAWHEVVGSPDRSPMLPGEFDAWRESAHRQPGSWWEDWAVWSAQRAGELGAPPTMGSAKNPVLTSAPGEYVFG